MTQAADVAFIVPAAHHGSAEELFTVLVVEPPRMPEHAPVAVIFRY